MKKIGNNTLNVQYSGSTLLVLSKLMFIFLQSKIFRRMILNFPPLKDQSPTDVCFYLFFFFLLLRKSFILTYRASAVIFALDNKFWKWNKIMLVILRIQFFPQWHISELADRQESWWWGMVQVPVAENVTLNRACSLSYFSYQVFSQQKTRREKRLLSGWSQKRKNTLKQKNWLSVLEQQEFKNALLF